VRSSDLVNDARASARVLSNEEPVMCEKRCEQTNSVGPRANGDERATCM
jgi:hypothetical protein